MSGDWGDVLVGEAAELLDRLKAGDESAFRMVVRQYHRAMKGLAFAYVGNKATADDVVQETWLTVIGNLSKFEGRSALKTWIFGILVNVARARARQERKSVPFSDLQPEDEGDEPAVDPSRFIATGFQQGQWGDPPLAWGDITPERIVGDRQLVEHMDVALNGLPPAQRSIIILRDLEGLDAEEARNVLGISEVNQRVLLHRARSRLRNAMEEILAPTGR